MNEDNMPQSTIGHKLDVTQAKHFIEAITGNASSICAFQVFDDRKKDNRRAKWKYGSLTELESWLKASNKEFCGIYMMVNEGDGIGRSACNVKRVRALFLDTDGAPHEPAINALPPQIFIESSQGRYHVYWLVEDCGLDQFTKIQKAIAARFGGDSSVSDLSRVMRLPGFYHHKKETPYLTKIVTLNKFPAYSLSEVVKRLALDDQPQFTATPQSKEPVLIQSDYKGGNEVIYTDRTTGEVKDLRKWAAKHPDFRIAAALREYQPVVLLDDPRDGKQHIKCPFDHEHTDKEPDYATFCMDGGASLTKGFVIQCLHSHCTGRDRLQFVKAMLELDWLPFSALTASHYLADDREPEYVPQRGRKKLKDAGFNGLSANERGQWLYIEFSMWFFFDGSLPDDEWLMARHMGMKPEEWQTFRGICIRLGILNEKDGRLYNQSSFEEYQEAKKLYNNKVRGGRLGGAS